MKYKVTCNDGRTFFTMSDGQVAIPLEITDWPVEKVSEFARIFNLS